MNMLIGGELMCFRAFILVIANAKIFMDNAGVHKKPVMIGETTPRNVGVLNGQTSWNQWFTHISSHLSTPIPN